jgi:hypothetical protein
MATYWAKHCQKKITEVTYFFLQLRFPLEVGRKCGRLVLRQPVESLGLFPIGKFLKNIVIHIVNI